jgi:hypothetical protein
VDYVRERVDSGYTWRQATDAYNKTIEKTIKSVLAVYRSVIDSSGSHEKAAEAVLGSLDRSLLEPGTEPVVTRTSLAVSWQGSIEEHIMFGRLTARKQPESQETYKSTTEEDIVRRKTRELAAWLDGRRRGTYFVLKSPRGTTILGGDAALRAVAQVDEARRGKFTEGPIDEIEMRRLLNVEKRGQP